MNSKAKWSTTTISDQPLKRKSSHMLCHGSLVKLLTRMTLRWMTTMMRLMKMKTRKMMRMRRQSKERRAERSHHQLGTRSLVEVNLRKVNKARGHRSVRSSEGSSAKKLRLL